MADRVLFISWGAGVYGREERGLEVFNEAMGLYGRLQQEGRIESFDVALLNPGTGVDGYIALHGSADQLAAIRDDEEFRRTLYAASLIVQDLKAADGYTNAGIAREMELYTEAISRVPQNA
ncbi:MAG: hypothetical protein QOH76_2062 [Thermoleophilaceae bacterium]|jgi:hypothetical protein|nr:hypothetical protein [Thermoleophilaceae bacterium]